LGLSPPPSTEVWVEFSNRNRSWEASSWPMSSSLPWILTDPALEWCALVSGCSCWLSGAAVVVAGSGVVVFMLRPRLPPPPPDMTWPLSLPLPLPLPLLLLLPLPLFSEFSALL
jgi:hypothetical protein